MLEETNARYCIACGVKPARLVRRFQMGRRALYECLCGHVYARTDLRGRLGRGRLAVESMLGIVEPRGPFLPMSGTRIA